MSIPSWEDAPEWANWRAKDRDGRWFWYESRPVHGESCWGACYPGARFCDAGEGIKDPGPHGDWKKSLTQRPRRGAANPQWDDPIIRAIHSAPDPSPKILEGRMHAATLAAIIERLDSGRPVMPNPDLSARLSDLHTLLLEIAA